MEIGQAYKHSSKCPVAGKPLCKKPKLEKPIHTLASLPRVRQLQQAVTTALGQSRTTLLHSLAVLPTNQITSAITQHAHDLDTVVDVFNAMPTQFAESHQHLPVDTTAAWQCHPLLLLTFKPVLTRGDGNCAYNALSLTLISS